MWLLSEERVQKQGRHTLCPRLCHPHFEAQCLCDLHVSKAQKTNKFTRVQKLCVCMNAQLLLYRQSEL
jgi:hypothetical protein